MPKIPVDEAPAGLHMDAAVAEVFETEPPFGSKAWGASILGYWEAYNGIWYPRPFSTNIAAAWEVITEARKIGFGFTISDNANRFAEHIDCRFWRLRDDMRRGIAIEGVAPLAICRAFLQANGVEHVEVPE
jgi:hypothetical protein